MPAGSLAVQSGDCSCGRNSLGKGRGGGKGEEGKEKGNKRKGGGREEGRKKRERRREEEKGRGSEGGTGEGEASHNLKTPPNTDGAEEARHNVLSYLLCRWQWCYRKYVVEEDFKYATPS